MWIKAGLCVFLSVLLPMSWAFYSDSDVTELTDLNFKNLVEEDDAIWVVQFYATWCGYSRRLAPEYKKLATAVKGVIKVGAVNDDDHQYLGSRFDVKSFPKIKIFGSNKRSPTDYKGERTAKAIAKNALAEAKKKIEDALGGGSSGISSSGDVVI